MAPNADMPDDAAQAEAFSLANIVPQDHNDNAGLWAAIEASVRATALIDGEVYVVTGPLFEGVDFEVLQGRVLVPTGLWKAIYDRSRTKRAPMWSTRRVPVNRCRRAG